MLLVIIRRITAHFFLKRPHPHLTYCMMQITTISATSDSNTVNLGHPYQYFFLLCIVLLFGFTSNNFSTRTIIMGYLIAKMGRLSVPKLIHIPKAIHISFSCYMVKVSVQVTETAWLRLGKDCSKSLKNPMLIVGRKLDANRSL